MRFIAAVALLAICQTALAAPPSPVVCFPSSMTSFSLLFTELLAEGAWSQLVPALLL